MTDKEKQIEEMAKPFTDFEKELLNELYKGLGIQDWRDECIWKTARVENCAIHLAKKYQPKIPEGSVVLSKEEYEELKFAKNLLELREETIKSLEDANIRYAEALELKVNKKERKETAEKFKKTFEINLLNNSVIDGYTLEELEFDGADIKEVLNDTLKQFDVEVEE